MVTFLKRITLNKSINKKNIYTFNRFCISKIRKNEVYLLISVCFPFIDKQTDKHESEVVVLLL